MNESRNVRRILIANRLRADLGGIDMLDALRELITLRAENEALWDAIRALEGNIRAIVSRKA